MRAADERLRGPAPVQGHFTSSRASLHEEGNKGEMIASPSKDGLHPRETDTPGHLKGVMIGKARIPALDLSLVWGWGMPPLPLVFLESELQSTEGSCIGPAK